jgi:hypothetical protein
MMEYQGKEVGMACIACPVIHWLICARENINFMPNSQKEFRVWLVVNKVLGG